MQRIGLFLCDAGLGVFSAIFICWIFGTHVTLGYLVVGIIFAYIPDIDWVSDKHFWKTGTVAAYAANPYDHREGLHKPLLWALVLSSWGLFVSTPTPHIALTAVMMHFLHDTTGTGWGMPWLWPLSKRRFKLFSTLENVLTFRSFFASWSYKELPHYITKYGRGNWKTYYYSTWTSVALVETLVAVLGLTTGVFALTLQYIH